MIIDAHCHIWEEKLVSADMQKILDAVTDRFKPKDPAQVRNGTINRLLREMDEAGIGKTVLLALDAGLGFRSHLTIRDYNDYVAAIVRDHPDRIIGFAGIDPRRGKEAVVELERCIEMGLKGLKLWTLTGFYPDDENYYPLYEKAAELKIPMLVHTGMGPPGTYMKFNRPMYVDKVAVDFPQISIILAHIGDPWIDEAVALVIKNPNVYVDISAWEPSVKFAPFVLCQTLTKIKMACGGLHKVLFGTDWPLFTPVFPLKEWVEAIRDLQMPPPLQMMGLQDFTERDKLMMLGENAARILGV
ncbi:MAG: amidohydrolase [Candidatus Lindowbacteria bacterium]|nr:amidohydrolase [Candidatus Lindowbacteria bacterium]